MAGSREGRSQAFVSEDEGLATKTDALLAGDASITEIDELRPLIAEGQERGFLTFEQIATALEEVEVSKEQVTELRGKAGAKSIASAAQLHVRQEK